MNYKNMKIEINESQPLDDVVKELERLGFKAWCVSPIDNGYAVTNKKGSCTTFYKDIWDAEVLTTLTELKAMNNDQTRPNRSNNPASFRDCDYLCRSVD